MHVLGRLPSDKLHSAVLNIKLCSCCREMHLIEERRRHERERSAAFVFEIEAVRQYFLTGNAPLQIFKIYENSPPLRFDIVAVRA